MLTFAFFAASKNLFIKSTFNYFLFTSLSSCCSWKASVRWDSMRFACSCEFPGSVYTLPFQRETLSLSATTRSRSFKTSETFMFCYGLSEMRANWVMKLATVFAILVYNGNSYDVVVKSELTIPERIA